MFPNKVTTIFYSPTKTSRKVAEAIASGINADEMRSIDLTLDESEKTIEIENSIVVIDVPVYSGRVAATALERLHRLKGNRPYLIPDALPPMAPVCTDWCVADGMCIDLCPTHAISFGDDGNIVTDPTKCTLCCACVKGCPNSARVFDTEFTELLHEQCKMRKEPELFI